MFLLRETIKMISCSHEKEREDFNGFDNSTTQGKIIVIECSIESEIFVIEFLLTHRCILENYYWNEEEEEMHKISGEKYHAPYMHSA